MKKQIRFTTFCFKDTLIIVLFVISYDKIYNKSSFCLYTYMYQKLLSSVDSRLTVGLFLAWILFTPKFFRIRQMENSGITNYRPTGMTGTVYMVFMACFVSNSYYLVLFHWDNTITINHNFGWCDSEVVECHKLLATRYTWFQSWLRTYL